MRAVALLAVLVPVLAGSAARAPAVSSVQLPRGATFSAVEPVGGRLLVSGPVARGSGCSWLTVNPTTLRLGTVSRGRCERAVLVAHPVAPAVFDDPRSFAARVRIARVDPATRRVSYGPVVTTFQEASDTHLEWTYGPGSLWLFETATPQGAQVFRVSAATGRVEDVVSLPRIFRPLLAADADGVWLAVATNGGAPGRGPATIYHVAPGARTAALVHRGGRAALWLAAAGHAVWADVVSGRSRQEIWRLDGRAGTAHALARADRLHASAVAVEPGLRALWALDDVPKGGRFLSCSGERVVRIDARTGAQAAVATVRLPQGRCATAAGATFALGAFYVLDASSERLYRVRP